MEAPVVSVLMAVYNAEAWLGAALQSLLGQSLPNIEIIAVDDASTDGSLQLLHEAAARDSRLRVFSQTVNQGQAVARNVALSHARGIYICMVDSDDWLSPDALERAVDVFCKYPQTDSVVFRLVLHYDEDGREEDYADAHNLDTSAVLQGEEAFRLSLDWTLHGLYLVRREIHLRYPFDDSLRLYSDDNTTRLHYLHSREVRFCTGIYYYRQHPTSSTLAISPRRFLYMQANYHMKQMLEQEGVSKEVRNLYERHRWHNYLGQLWLFFTHRRQFAKDERNQIVCQLRSLYGTFSRKVPFGLFYAEQWLRWRSKGWR